MPFSLLCSLPLLLSSSGRLVQLRISDSFGTGALNFFEGRGLDGSEMSGIHQILNSTKGKTALKMELIQGRGSLYSLA